MALHDPALDRLFTTLGDPTRRAILARLARGPASVGELAAPHGMALPSFLAHIDRLTAAGLVTSEKQGRVRTVRLAPAAFAPAQDWLSEQRALWEGRLDRFDDYVQRLAKGNADGPRPAD